MSCTLEIPRESIERLRLPDVVLAVDPTATNVDFAFLSVVDPRPVDSADWEAGSYDSIVDNGDGTWTAVLATPLLGTGDLDLAPGWWHVFVRFTFTPELPVLDLGTFLIT